MTIMTLTKKLSVATIGATYIALAGTSSAHAATLGFDDLVPNLGNPPSEGQIPNGYGGLNWTNFSFVDTTFYPGSGYANGTVSGNNVAFIGFPDKNFFSELSSSVPFTFNSAYFTGAFNSLDILIQGFQGTNPVFSQTVAINTTGPTLFSPNLGNIDRVRFTPQNPSNGNLYFAMDDFTYTAVPTPALLPGLLAFGASVLKKRRQQETQPTEEATDS